MGLYEGRIKEWDELLRSTQSETLKALLKYAKTTTEQSFVQFVDLQRMSIVIMAAIKITFDNNVGQCASKIKQLSKDIQAARTATMQNERLEFFKRALDEVNSRVSKEKAIYDLGLNVYTLCISEFQRVLELIYQPRNGSFHYESIVDAFEYIADKLIFGLSEFKSVQKIVPAVRRKAFAQSGDKLILYIEQYNYVLETWMHLAEAYVDLLDE